MLDGNEDSGELDVKKQVTLYVDHIETVARVFNDHSRELGLGVALNPEGAVNAIKSGTGFSRVTRFYERVDDSGVLHDAQLMTALNCVGELLTSPHRNGLVLGAMQSGKTTTSIALQFAGPIVYQLTGKRLYPIYLITSHTSQEDQTKIEIARFLDFYGELAVEVDGQRPCTIIQYMKQNLDPAFVFAPTINMYREHVLQKALPDTMIGPKLDDFIQRRVKGESIKRVADLCKRANSKNFTPLLIIDEPQFGASDRFVKVEDKIERRSCVLLQIFDSIDAAIGDDSTDRVFIGLSATPYELHDIDAVWKVNQYLTSTYSGFNYFGGKVIDVDAEVMPPKTLSFAQFAKEIGAHFLSNVSLAAYDADPHIYERYARKIGFAKGQTTYRSEVEATLRATILHMARNGTSNRTGICLRLFNNNVRSHKLIQRLRLPDNEINVIEYFGSDHKGQSVKRAIRQRSRPDLPFLVVVTNRARMGDAFPREVEWFLEFSKKAANLNALLQGLLGRACGYGKNSTIVMSQENADLVEDYKRAQGDYIYKTSSHSTVVGPFRRGAPTNLVRVNRNMDDELVRKFFEQLDKDVVGPHIIQSSATLRTKRSSSGAGFRTGPLLRLAEELNLFDHLEKPEVREKLFPTYPDFRIARTNEVVSSIKNPDHKLRYTLDADGNCRFTFREWAEGGNHGGVRSRGYGERDAKDKSQAGDTLEPQVNMRKFDPATGQPIDDKKVGGVLMDRTDRVEGDWRAEMVTLPLVSAVRELQAGDITFPVEHSPFADLMSVEERIHAGYES